MTTAKEIYNHLEHLYPLSGCMPRDNCGFLAGKQHAKTDTIMLSLDITLDTIKQANDAGAQLIISHHPLLFDAADVADTNIQGARIIQLLSNNLAAICMHTNLDSAPGGINQTLARLIGLEDISFCTKTDSDNGFGIGRIGVLQPVQSLPKFLKTIQKALGCNGLRYFNSGKDVRNVMVGSGSCGEYLEVAARLGCDTFVTADVKHDRWLAAAEFGINLIDAGHFHTENIFIQPVKAVLEKQFPQLKICIANTPHPCKFANFEE